MFLITTPYVRCYHCYLIIIYQGIIAPGHGKEVVDGINAITKRYIYQLMSNVQLPGSKHLIHTL